MRIGVDGAVTGVEALTSSSPGNGFEEVATEAVANWRYVPAPVRLYKPDLAASRSNPYARSTLAIRIS